MKLLGITIFFLVCWVIFSVFLSSKKETTQKSETQNLIITKLKIEPYTANKEKNVEAKIEHTNISFDTNYSDATSSMRSNFENIRINAVKQFSRYSCDFYN